MLNLAFVGSGSEAERYGAIVNRIDGARWFAFVPLDACDSCNGKDLLGAEIEEKSLENLLQAHVDKVDAIVVHAPSERLRNLVKTATQSAKPVLAGPLLARHIDELNVLYADLEQEQELLVPACPWRFIPAIQSVKASIDAGKLGEVGLLRMHRWHSNMMEKNNDIADRIIPAIDIATWFFAAKPEKIMALKSPSVSGYIQLHLQFANKGMALIDDTGALPQGGEYFSLTVIGGKGAAYADDHRNMNLIVDGAYPHAIRIGQGAVPITGQLQAFVNTVRNEQPAFFSRQVIFDVLQVSNAVLAALAASKVAVWQDGKYACC